MPPKTPPNTPPLPSTLLPDTCFSIWIAASPETVWAEITRLGGVQSFYFGKSLQVTGGELLPGRSLAYVDLDDGESVIVGEILEVTPPLRWAHTFAFTEEAHPPSRVDWTLTPENSGTRVTVTHTALQPSTRATVSGGWPRILDQLKQLLETGPIPAPARLHP